MKKIILLVSFFLVGVLGLSAQVPSDSDFADDSFVQDGGFTDGFAGTGSSLQIGAELTLPVRIEPKSPSSENLPVGFVPEFLTELDFSTNQLDIHGGLRVRVRDGESEVSVNEAWMRYYAGVADFEVGLMKVTWGTGDQYHVIDAFNASDFRQSVELDYSERKLAEFMVRANIPVGGSGRIELIFVPWFTPDVYAEVGIWVPRQSSVLQTLGEAALEAYAAEYYTAVFIAGGGTSAAAGQAALATASRMEEARDAFIRKEHSMTLEHSQGGVRFTSSEGPLDWGVALARVYMRDSIVQAVDLNVGTITAVSDPHVNIRYTPVLMAAQEAALVLGGWNFREEAAFRLSRDLDGRDPEYRNSRVDWLWGFDRDFFRSRLNANIQIHGRYVLQTEGLDVDDPDGVGDFHVHRLIGMFSGDFVRGTVQPSISGAWVIENNCWYLNPEVTLILGDVVDLDFGARVYEGSQDTDFGQYSDRDNVYFCIKMRM